MTTDPATRAAARETVACDFCDQPAGAVCRTKAGAATTVHAARVHDYGVWMSRQPEVDQLRAAVVAGLEFKRVADETVATLNGIINDQTTQLSNLATALTASENAREDALQDAADVQAAFDAWKAGHGEPEPVQRTLFGACPRAGDTAQGVVTRWGKGAAVRIFASVGAATRPAGAGIVHVSWKPTLTGITDTWVKSVTAALEAGDCVEVWHESDKKVTDGTLSYPDAVARKNAFHDSVKRVRPDLLVVNTLTGWLLDPKSGGDVERWAAVKADVLGVDCDGVRPTKLPYTDYTGETTRALKFLTDHPGYRWFAVPEFGCPRIPAEDPDGTKRAAYHEKYAALWGASGKALFVTLYEYESSVGYALTSPAEIDGWRAHV